MAARNAPAIAGMILACAVGLLLTLAPLLTAIYVLGAALTASVLAVIFWGLACEAAARGDDLPAADGAADTLYTDLMVRTSHLMAR